ncbi:hypothetical protein NC652_030997 [Populus alba x Populus x berolinensis]|nr:hypothetical protein NC652_030997 [Populus alba x Populus x berolinensis]
MFSGRENPSDDASVVVKCPTFVGWLAQTKTHSRPIRLFPQLNVQHSAFHLDGLKRRHLF